MNVASISPPVSLFTRNVIVPSFPSLNSPALPVAMPGDASEPSETTAEAVTRAIRAARRNTIPFFPDIM